MKKVTLIITLALIIIVINIIAQVNPKKVSKAKSSNKPQTTTKSSSQTFTDTRDGKVYKIVKIGTQTWMAQNLAYKTENGCMAYDNNDAYVKTYGYLYSWEAAKNACPAGWHLPSVDEWYVMINYIGGEQNAGKKLKEKGRTHWKKDVSQLYLSTNEYGFTALPGGELAYGPFRFEGESGFWWSSTKERFRDEETVSFFKIFDSGNFIEQIWEDPDPTKLALSVRCIKD